MIKEPRNRELTREDVYAEYFSRLADQEHRCVDSVFYDRMKEVNGIFKGKTQLELMIKGTVYTNLSLPKKLQGISLSREEAISFLEDVGLDQSFLDQDAMDLSGGQRQRVSIARTLVNKSDILLLDEITSALDKNSVKEVEDLIVKLNKKYNVTIIWITHNLEQAIHIGHYTWAMMDGRVIETGESNFLNSPTKERVKQFVQGGLA